MAHFTCVGATVDELRATLDADARRRDRERARAARRPAAGRRSEWTATEGGLSYSRELIELIRDDYDFAIGAACFPEIAHPRRLGARTTCATSRRRSTRARSFLITQLFFDNQLYFDFVAPRARRRDRRADRAGDHADHATSTQIKRFTRDVRRRRSRPACSRELELRARRAARRSPTSASPTRRCSAPSCSPAARPGIHFYTLNRSPGDARDPQRAAAACAPWRRAARRRDLERVGDAAACRRRPRSVTSTESFWR